MRTIEKAAACAALLIGLTGIAQASGKGGTCPAIGEAGLLFVDCRSSAIASLVMVAAGEPVSETAISAPEGGTRLAVTGAYTSGERHEPEGLFIRAGEVLDPYPQGWDGLALIDGDGRISLHYVGRVRAGEKRWNLREKDSRKDFVATAKAKGWSAFQSHMLVIDGAVDTKPRPSAPIFRRRILFELPNNGGIGIFDSGDDALTLHEAAELVAERFAPVMALNLDMGSYDFCQEDAAGVTQRCGALSRAQTGKLTNLLVLTRGAAKIASTGGGD